MIGPPRPDGPHTVASLIEALQDAPPEARVAFAVGPVGAPHFVWTHRVLACSPGGERMLRADHKDARPLFVLS